MILHIQGSDPDLEAPKSLSFIFSFVHKAYNLFITFNENNKRMVITKA